MIPKPHWPPRVWKFWGTALRGLFIFAGVFVGQVGGYRLFRAATPRFARLCRGDPRHRRRNDDLAVGDLWIASRAGGDVDRHSPDPHAVCLFLPNIWRYAGPRGEISLFGIVALALLVGCWDLLSRALGREVTPGFMGEVMKPGAGRRRAVASGDRVLRCRADLGRDLCGGLP